MELNIINFLNKNLDPHRDICTLTKIAPVVLMKELKNMKFG
jgi:hypothetical protein